MPADLDADVFLPPAGSYIWELTVLVRENGELLIASVEIVVLERCRI